MRMAVDELLKQQYAGRKRQVKFRNLKQKVIVKLRSCAVCDLFMMTNVVRFLRGVLVTTLSVVWTSC
jgi:hypothetical protein